MHAVGCSERKHQEGQGRVGGGGGGGGGGASTLFKATTKGVLRILSRLMDSMVCCSRPCIMSTTRMAMSHKLDPRDLRLENDS